MLGSWLSGILVEEINMCRHGVPAIERLIVLALWMLFSSSTIHGFTFMNEYSVPQKAQSNDVLLNKQVLRNIIRFVNIKLYSQYDDDETSDDYNSSDDVSMGPVASNVLGTTLCSCCSNVGNTGIGTGFYRNGYCSTGQDDLGRHTVCVQVTDEFLTFSKAVGNDLTTRMPQYLFPGLNAGDIWCLCAERWVQAYNAGMAPKLYLKATHEKTLDYISFDILRQYAIDQDEADATIDSLNEQRSKLNKLL